VPRPKPPAPWLKQFGDNVRRERTAKGMTQHELAEGADLNIRNLQRIEAGEIDLLLRTAVRIRKALDCPLEKLMPKD
jgi:transcriptional regulator with XRE-family HTH domain